MSEQAQTVARLIDQLSAEAEKLAASGETIPPHQFLKLVRINTLLARAQGRNVSRPGAHARKLV